MFPTVDECTFVFPLQGKKSLYASDEEFQGLIKQVLSWDIRSVSQRKNQPHNSIVQTDNASTSEKQEGEEEETRGDEVDEEGHISHGNVTYHLVLEGMDVSYRIDSNANILVEKVSLPSQIQNAIIALDQE